MPSGSRLPRKRLVRCARRDIAWALAAFAALQLGLAIAMLTRWSALRDPTYGARAERLAQRMDAAGSDAFTLVMVGSSRAYDGFRGRLLETRIQPRLEKPLLAFNLAIPGGGPVRELLTLRRLLDADIPPDLLLVEVTPSFLAPEGALHDAAAILPSRVWPSEFRLLERHGAPRIERRDWWAATLVPWYGHRFSLMSRIFPAVLPVEAREDTWFATDAWGTHNAPQPELTAESRQVRTELACRRYRRLLAEFRLGGPSCHALRELLERCRDEHIPTALVLMPEGETFRALYPPEVRKQVYAFVEGLKNEFGSPVIDGTLWVADDGFADSHHLTRRGAEVFTTRLADELLPILTPLAGPHARNSAPASTVNRVRDRSATRP